MRPLITLGDRTSHGGTVITADFTFDIHGKCVARVGDLSVCPRCKGIFAITSGADDATSMGQAIARHGDKTACGATLLSSQVVTTWSSESRLGLDSAAANAVVSGRANAAIAAEAPTICLECLAAAAMAGQALVVRA